MRLAQRVLHAGADLEHRIVAAWRLTFGRSPQESEIRLAVEHVERQRIRFEQALATNVPGDFLSADPESLAWVSLCLVLFNSNEFLYVD
jgi:hypothetical protein